MLYEFVAANRDEIIRRCIAKVATRSIPPPTIVEMDHGVPVFLDQLVTALRVEAGAQRDITISAIQHGHELLAKGFTVSQVVHDYGDVCQSITQLAVESDTPIGTDDFRMLNQCLDDAIAGAVTAYGNARNQATHDKEASRGTEQLGFLAHELRNLVNTAIMAFEVLKSGDVGVKGSTGNVLQRSLLGLRAIVGHSLAEVRLERGTQHRETFLVSEFIEEIGPTATMEARGRGITLITEPVVDPAMIEADRQMLASVVGNLLQNAFKFTKKGTTVTLRVCAGAERVLIEVQDECGGLPGGNANELFRPFEQRATNRTGLGLGLAFSRRATEAMFGRLYGRNLPNQGCVFTVDLPRVVATPLAGPSVGTGSSTTHD